MTREESAESDENSNLFAPSFRKSHLHFAVVQELSLRRRARPASAVASDRAPPHPARAMQTQFSNQNLNKSRGREVECLITFLIL